MKPGLRYGGLAFLAGLLLRPVRDLLLTPWLGGLAAAWIEAAALAVLFWAAAALALNHRRGDLVQGVAARLGAGLLALAVVIAAESALWAVLVLTGLAQPQPPRSAAEQVPGLLLLAWLVAIPLLRRPVA